MTANQFNNTITGTRDNAGSDSAAAPIQFTGADMVRDIVLQFPKAADYFKGQRIDFCCGGAKPLAEVAAEKGLDSETLLADLHKLLKEHPVLDVDTALMRHPPLSWLSILWASITTTCAKSCP